MESAGDARRTPGMEIGTNKEGLPVVLSVQSMLRHAVVLGASGSGKTVACKVLVEEAVRNGIPVIAIDPQGDLASLAELGNPGLAQSKGVSRKTCREWRTKADVKIWTPASTLGIPLSISPKTDVPRGIREEDRIRAFGAIANNLADITGQTRKSEELAAAFAMVLEYADEHELLIENLTDFANFLADPPRALRERLDTLVTEAVRKSAERAFRVKMLGAQRLLFSLGRPINIERLLGFEPGGARDRGKVRVSVIYLNTLASPEEKEVFLGAICNAMYTWMLAHPSQKPQALFYIDEAAPYLPPVRKPACKASLMLLLRQARKYGVSCLLATQSPGDLDYKALGQIGTWMLGRMRTPQEAAKVEPALSAQPGVDSQAIIDRLPSFGVGEFIISSPDNYPEPEECQVRWLVSNHRTVNESGLEELVSAADRERLG